jgi:phospholipid-translocating ATPase
VQAITEPEAVTETLKNLARRPDYCLVIDGNSLQRILDAFPGEFIEYTCKMSAVVCCRCSPTQKALVTELLKKHTGQIVCSVGDGGNDVSMIQAANVGIGIVGKEGKQASLASDVSITQFSHITRLFLWHGRSCYRSTAKVAQFVIHRGVILTVMQAVFCGIFYVAPIALYKGLLTVGYSTVFTMFPVFSLVLDHDVCAGVALRYPELYKELVKGRCLSGKTFFAWMCKSVYQGGVIMLLTLQFFEYELLHMAAITYSALIMNELLMIGLEVHTWHPLMFVAEAFSLGCFLICMLFFKEYFNIDYKDKISFLANMAIIACVSFLPFIVFKVFHRLILPPSYSKLK